MRLGSCLLRFGILPDTPKYDWKMDTMKSGPSVGIFFSLKCDTSLPSEA